MTRLGAALRQSPGSRRVRFLGSLRSFFVGMFSGERYTERPSAFMIWAAPAELGRWLGGRDLPVDLCRVGGQTPETGGKGVDFYLLHRWRAITFLVKHVVGAVEAQHDGLVRRRTDGLICLWCDSQSGPFAQLVVWMLKEAATLISGGWRLNSSWIINTC